MDGHGHFQLLKKDRRPKRGRRSMTCALLRLEVATGGNEVHSSTCGSSATKCHADRYPNTPKYFRRVSDAKAGKGLRAGEVDAVVSYDANLSIVEVHITYERSCPPGREAQHAWAKGFSYIIHDDGCWNREVEPVRGIGSADNPGEKSKTTHELNIFREFNLNGGAMYPGGLGDVVASVYAGDAIDIVAVQNASRPSVERLHDRASHGRVVQSKRVSEFMDRNRCEVDLASAWWNVERPGFGLVEVRVTLDRRGSGRRRAGEEGVC